MEHLVRSPFEPGNGVPQDPFASLLGFGHGGRGQVKAAPQGAPKESLGLAPTRRVRSEAGGEGVRSVFSDSPILELLRFIFV